MQNPSKLTIQEIIEAFPQECGEIIPREIKRLKRSVRHYESLRKNILSRHYEDPWKERGLLLFIKAMYEPIEEIRIIRHLEAIITQQTSPTANDSITPDMVARAKAVPIETLYNFEKIIRTTGRIKAICPFHGEKTPSFVIYTQRSGSSSENTFHCFGCGKGRDAIDFYCLINGLSLPRDFPRAVKALAG